MTPWDVAGVCVLVCVHPKYFFWMPCHLSVHRVFVLKYLLCVLLLCERILSSIQPSDWWLPSLLGLSLLFGSSSRKMTCVRGSEIILGEWLPGRTQVHLDRASVACSDGRGYLPHWLSACVRDKLHGFATAAGCENATRRSDGFWECAGAPVIACSWG